MVRFHHPVSTFVTSLYQSWMMGTIEYSNNDNIKICDPYMRGRMGGTANYPQSKTFPID